MLRVEEVAQHYDMLLAARRVDERLDVSENNGVDINVEQVFVAQRTIGVEQFHFRPPTNQVGILQRQRFDAPDVREIGKAHRIRRQLVVDEARLFFLVLIPSPQYGNDLHTIPRKLIVGCWRVRRKKRRACPTGRFQITGADG